MGFGAQIWCLRHGESAESVGGHVTGLPGGSLTRTGRAQAVAAAATLGSLVRRPTRVYASTAVGAIQTADLLASELRLVEPLIPLNGLVEVGFGPRTPATEGDATDVLLAWAAHDGLDARVAGGESGREVVARVTSALRTIAADNTGGVVALVGHVASLTAGIAALCKIGPLAFQRPLPPAVPFRLDTDGSSWHCSEWPS